MNARTVAEIIEDLLSHDGDVLTQLLPNSDSETEYALYNLSVLGMIAHPSGVIHLDLEMTDGDGEVTDMFDIAITRVQPITERRKK